MGRARTTVAGFVVVLLAVAATVVAASPAAADGNDQGGSNGSPVNTAIVQNTTDGSSVFKLAFQVRTITDAGSDSG